MLLLVRSPIQSYEHSKTKHQTIITNLACTKQFWQIVHMLYLPPSPLLMMAARYSSSSRKFSSIVKVGVTFSPLFSDAKSLLLILRLKLPKLSEDFFARNAERSGLLVSQCLSSAKIKLRLSLLASMSEHINSYLLGCIRLPITKLIHNSKPTSDNWPMNALCFKRSFLGAYKHAT